MVALRPIRRRALREDGPQRDRVRLDAGICGGSQRPQARERRPSCAGDGRRDHAAPQPRALHVRARRRCDHGGLAPRLRHLVLAAGPHRPGAERLAEPRRLRRPCERLWRRSLDGASRGRGRRSGAGPRCVALRPLRLARRGGLGEPCALRDAARVRWPPREEPGAMSEATITQDNPLLEGLSFRRTPDPCSLVIFGASGDLTHKKLMPALYSLAFRRLLPPRFAVVGVARTEGDDDTWRADMKQAVQQHARDEFRQDVWDELAASMHYVATDFADEGGEDALHQTVERCDAQSNLGGNRVYYLAVPPPAFPTIVEALGKRRSATGWTRLIVEKPFGHDLASARELNTMLREHFAEEEIFRIDHYLGKETVQNMLALRFANGIFEPIWNRQFIDHVQITVAESIGIEGRAGYYESAGAIRDIFQNHLLQLL